MIMIEQKKQLVIIDGFAVFFRAYYSHPEMLTSDNINVNAVYGFINMVLRIVKDFKKADVCVALDSGKATFRDKMFSEYKANRQATPDDLKPQFAIMHEALKAMEIPHFIKEGYEADDIIATFAKQASHDSRTVMIASLDKDLAQLVRYNNVFMYDFSKKQKLGRAEIFAKFGIMPEYIADYLALVGDASDNIPGVKSIGAKTAVNLITQFGGLDSIYDNVESIEKQGVKNALKNNRDNAFLSKSLTMLCETVALPHLNETKFDNINKENLINFSKKYNLYLNL